MSRFSNPLFAGLVAGLCAITAAPLAAQSLAGSTWHPVPQAGAAAPEGDKTFMQFDADGNVAGNGGCNGFRGRYVTNGEAILFGPVAATMMLCPDAISDAENQFLQNLAAARLFVLEEDTLRLSDTDGTLLLELTRQDPE